MKLKFLTLGIFACFFFIFTNCSETEVLPSSPGNSTDSDYAISPDALRSPIAEQTFRKVITVPMTGTINGIPFTAAFQISRFSNVGKTIQGGGKLYAHGRLRNIQGANLPAAIVSLQKRELKVPVILSTSAASQAAALVVCDVLYLNLGPLDLDLLGLTIHLDRVVLDINAIPGAGNLVGNLLCAIVSLLDGPGILALIVQILNEIISIIGTLLPV